MELSKPEILAVIMALIGTIGSMWLMIRTWLCREQRRLQKCEVMHQRAIEEIKDLNGKYNYLQGRMDGVEKLSNSVLSKIKERRTLDERGTVL